jgi:hypothetical protein
MQICKPILLFKYLNLQYKEMLKIQDTAPPDTQCGVNWLEGEAAANSQSARGDEEISNIRPKPFPIIS